MILGKDFEGLVTNCWSGIKCISLSVVGCNIHLIARVQSAHRVAQRGDGRGDRKCKRNQSGNTGFPEQVNIVTAMYQSLTSFFWRLLFFTFYLFYKLFNIKLPSDLNQSWPIIVHTDTLLWSQETNARAVVSHWWQEDSMSSRAAINFTMTVWCPRCVPVFILFPKRDWHVTMVQISWISYGLLVEIFMQYLWSSVTILFDSHMTILQHFEWHYSLINMENLRCRTRLSKSRLFWEPIFCMFNTTVHSCVKTSVLQWRMNQLNEYWLNTAGFYLLLNLCTFTINYF